MHRSVWAAESGGAVEFSAETAEGRHDYCAFVTDLGLFVCSFACPDLGRIKFLLFIFQNYFLSGDKKKNK